jgi:Secretion system C-terminal sorting domain
MRRLLLLLALFTFASISFAQLNPTLTVVGGVPEAQSNQPFKLDLAFGSNANTCGEVEVDFYYNASRIDYVGFDPNAVISSPPVAANGIVKFKINGLSSLGTSIKLSFKYKRCTTCNGDTADFFAKAGSLTCPPELSNTITMKGKAKNEFTTYAELISNQSTICVGGVVHYRVHVSNPDDIGSYQLLDPLASLSVPPGAQLVAIQDESGNNIANDVTSSSAPAIEWKANKGQRFDCASLFNKYYDVFIIYPCETGFNVGDTILNTPTLTGTNPCGVRDTISFIPVKTIFKSLCCGQPVSPTLTKGLFNFDPLCPGSCAIHSYFISFNNISSNKYSSAQLIDNIPDEVNVETITTDITSSYFNAGGTLINLFYELNHSGVWLGPVAITAPNTFISVIAGSCSNIPNCISTGGGFISRVRWDYDPFFTGIATTNQIGFKILANSHAPGNPAVPAGVEIINNATITSNKPPLNLSVNYPLTTVACLPDVDLLKRVSKTCGNFLSATLDAFPEDTIYVRLRIRNEGPPVTNLTITDQLNNAYKFIPGSPIYSYGTSNPPCTNYSATPPAGIGNISVSAPTGNGGTVKFSGFNLPACDSKYLNIIFRVVIDKTTPPGILPNRFKASLGTDTIKTSNTAPVNVLALYRVMAEMKVRCKTGGAFVTSLKAKQGDLLEYQYTVKNEGNVTLTDLNIFNLIPRSGDFKTLEGVSGFEPRGSQFTIDYNCNAPAGVTASYFTGGPAMCRDCIGISPAGCTPATPGGCNGATAACFSNGTATLAPGASLVFITDAVVGAGTLNQKAHNSFGLRLKRLDNNQLAPQIESNLATVVYDSIGCPRTPCTPGCTRFVSSQFVCDNGKLKFTFTLYNATGLTATSIRLTSTAPPITINIPQSIAPQTTSALITVDLSAYNLTTGSTVCFTPSILFTNPGNIPCPDTICSGSPVCLTVPNCTPCNCGFWKYRYMQNTNDWTVQTLNCNSQYNVKCDQPYNFSFAYSCTGTCAPTYKVSIVAPDGSSTDYFETSPELLIYDYYFSLPGQYTMTIEVYCGDKLCSTCTIRFVTDCGGGGDCVCGGWKGITMQQGYSSTPIECNGNYVLACNSSASFSFDYQCIGECSPRYVVSLITPGGYPINFPGGSGSPFVLSNIKFNQSGTYTLVIDVYCGEQLCEHCEITFSVYCGGKEAPVLTAPDTRNQQTPAPNSFKVYPNPVKDFVNISYLGKAGVGRVDLLDVQGRIVRVLQFTGQTTGSIDMRGLPKGLYTLRNGRHVIGRIVKE